MAHSVGQRLAVARELHDGIAQDLVGIGYSLDILLAESGLTNSSRSQIRTIRLHTDELIAKVRREIFNLRRGSESFTHSLKAITAEILGATAFDITLDEVFLSEEIAAELLVIATEILRNISQHAGANHVVIKLFSVNNRTCLEISDDGIGGVEMRDGHFGLQGIIERAENLGGIATFENQNGTKIAILV